MLFSIETKMKNEGVMKLIGYFFYHFPIAETIELIFFLPTKHSDLLKLH